MKQFRANTRQDQNRWKQTNHLPRDHVLQTELKSTIDSQSLVKIYQRETITFVYVSFSRCNDFSSYTPLRPPHAAASFLDLGQFYFQPLYLRTFIYVSPEKRSRVSTSTGDTSLTLRLYGYSDAWSFQGPRFPLKSCQTKKSFCEFIESIFVCEYAFPSRSMSHQTFFPCYKLQRPLIHANSVFAIL